MTQIKYDSIKYKQLINIMKKPEDKLLHYLDKLLNSCGYTTMSMLPVQPKPTKSKKKKKGKTETYYGDGFVYAKGDIPIMLIAHVDTVHKSAPEYIFFDETKQVMWSPNGLGADDRAGVFAIVHLLELGYRPHILFTDGEESGGSGAESFIDTVLRLSDDTLLNDLLSLKYMVELDRQGRTDAVFYSESNSTFISFVCDYGFKEQYGSFTDISILCPEFEVSGVNLSIGYLNQHSATEFLCLSWLFETVAKVETMLKDVPDEGFVYTPEYSYWSKSYRYWDDMNTISTKSYTSTDTEVMCQFMEWSEDDETYYCLHKNFIDDLIPCSLLCAGDIMDCEYNPLVVEIRQAY